MAIRQLSIFLENRKGRLANITSIIAGANISIIGLSIADTAEFGILRLIVDDVNGAENILKGNNIVYHVNDVTAVEVDRNPGGLSKVLNLLNTTSINVEYMYALAQYKVSNPVLILRFSEPSAAREILRQGGCTLLDEAALGIR